MSVLFKGNERNLTLSQFTRVMQSRMDKRDLTCGEADASIRHVFLILDSDRKGFITSKDIQRHMNGRMDAELVFNDVCATLNNQTCRLTFTQFKTVFCLLN